MKCYDFVGLTFITDVLLESLATAGHNLEGLHFSGEKGVVFCCFWKVDVLLLPFSSSKFFFFSAQVHARATLPHI